MSETTSAGSRPAYKSKTAISFGVTALTAIVALVLHYTGAVLLGAEALPAAWTSAIMGVVGFVLRFWTDGRVTLTGQGGAARVQAIPVLSAAAGLALLAAWMLGGCASVEFLRDSPVTMTVDVYETMGGEPVRCLVRVFDTEDPDFYVKVDAPECLLTVEEDPSDG